MSSSLQTLRIYTSYWRRHPVLFSLACMMGPAYVLQAIIAPLCIAKSLNQLIAHHPVSALYIWAAGISVVSAAILRFIADRGGIMPLMTLNTRDLYNANFKHMLQQEYGFFADNFAGSLVAQANRFAKGYEIFSNVIFFDVIGLLCGVLVALGIMTYYNPLIGLSIAVLWVGAVSVVILLALKRARIRRQAVAKETQQTGELADAITNAITVKTFAREADEMARYDATNRTRAQRFHFSWTLAARNSFVTILMCGVLQLAVFIGGIAAVQHAAITIPTFLLFQLYILRVIDSLGVASTSTRQFEGFLGDTHEMAELLTRTPRILDPANPEPCRIRKGVIAIENVRFDYTPESSDSRALLNDFTLHIAAGEKVGLVGPSGGGKSTITKLLLRFVDIQAGAITIDGQNIQAITQADLHNAIAYVPQEPLMFHRSIRENIRYGKPDATDAEIIRVAKQAHAHDFITSLPHGYDTLVGERGIKLSGGQRQRIAIARAMIKTAPILILDEATSALDSESEQYIQQGLWQLMEHKTTLVIAHRLSTIQKLDRIIVLDEGRILEEGTHKQLLKKKGLYATLWTHQSGGFIEE